MPSGKGSGESILVSITEIPFRAWSVRFSSKGGFDGRIRDILVNDSKKIHDIVFGLCRLLRSNHTQTCEKSMLILDSCLWAKICFRRELLFIAFQIPGGKY